MTAQQLRLFGQPEPQPRPATPSTPNRYQTPDGIGQVAYTPLPTPGKAWVRFPDGTTRAYPYEQLIPAPAPTPAGFRDTGERHTYGDNGTYLEVSDEAADERRRRWHEFVGWADGYAKVNHPDWIKLYDYMLSTCPYMVECYPEPWRWGPSFLVIVKRPSGELTHAGSICCRDGQVELNG